MTTKDYTKQFVELMKLLVENSSTNIGESVEKFFAAETSDSRLWPSDERFSEALLTLPVYQLLTRGRLRILLEAIENSLRTDKSEEAHVQKGLTIEHVMPIAWRQYWELTPAEIGSELQLAQNRDRIVHTIGNLTLVTKSLNPTLSNWPWIGKQDVKSKRDEIQENSVLHLNKILLADAGDQWNESTIESRGRDLAKRACQIWPHCTV